VLTGIAQNLLIKFKSLPELLRMAIIAVIGAGISFITYEIIYFFNPFNPKASTSWAMAFMINIARQHALHRWLTFSKPAKYWSSLLRAYIMYAGSVLLSSLLNWFLTEYWSINHRLAWVICTLLIGAFSFVFLKRFVFRLSGPKASN
jgi:putative flippase GtrA